MPTVKLVAAISGGSRGIGRAVAELFARQGYEVAVCSRNPPADSLPAEWFWLGVDVRRRQEVEHFFQQIDQRWGRLDVLINAAGASGWSSIRGIEEQLLEEILATGILGTLWACGCAAERMGPGGAIVNLSSLAGKRGSANNSAYCAAKFAVNGITQSLAKELGPQKIRVNAVCPVYVETDQLLEALAGKESPAAGQSVASYLKWFASTQTALGRLPSAAEVANTVYYLAGPAASAITGQCINVDCGTLPQ